MITTILVLVSPTTTTISLFLPFVLPSWRRATYPSTLPGFHLKDRGDLSCSARGLTVVAGLCSSLRSDQFSEAPLLSC